MKIYKILALVLCALCARAVSNAQAMETLAYSPLKNGNYNIISTKSLARLATDAGAKVNIANLKANSSTLFLNTQKVTFTLANYSQHNIDVLNGVFTKPNVDLNIKGDLKINGYFYANGGLNGGIEIDSSVRPMFSATTINASNKTLIIPEDSVSPPRVVKVYIGGIALQRPTCASVGWVQFTSYYDASKALKNDTIKVFGCL
ncbi:MAG: hypothetical protein LBL61_01525 [Elusimicrobiota bacterium]|jgi:hypothetical protein|nr:hypothetical protein [Elusimicrobiota bacterium]